MDFLESPLVFYELLTSNLGTLARVPSGRPTLGVVSDRVEIPESLGFNQRQT